MLRDAERGEKIGIVSENFRRCVAAVKIAEQTGDGFDDERIGIAVKKTSAIAKICDKPKLGEAAGNQVCVPAQIRCGQGAFSGLVNEQREPVLAVFQNGKLRREFNLFFREVHGAEDFSINMPVLRAFGFRRRARFFVLRFGFLMTVRFLVVCWGFFGLFFAVLVVFARGAGRIVVARVAESLRLAGRLDAAERAAEFVNLAFVGELLPLGDFDQFEHFVEMINHLLEAIGNFRGVFDGLADGRGVGGSEIRITRTRRSWFRGRRAFQPLVALSSGRPFRSFGPVRAIRAFRPLRHEALRRRADRLCAFAFHCCRRLLRNRRFTGHFARSGFRCDFVSG